MKMKKPKGYMRGGMMKKTPKDMKKGGKLEMVEKGGKMVPFFAADGQGKMKEGGMVPKTKGYFKGGRTMKNKMDTKGGAKGGGMKGGGRAMKNKMNTKGGKMGGKG